MHALKIIALVVLYLATLRGLSWLIGWVLHKVARASVRTTAVAANASALALYFGFLFWDRIPGDSLDVAAATVGTIVFLLCFFADLRWTPWAKAARN